MSRYETGNILPPLTVVDVVARLLNTTIADLLGEAPIQPVEHADRIGIWLTSLPLSDRDWIERVVKQLVERCQPRKRGRPRTQLRPRLKVEKVPAPPSTGGHE